MTTRAIIARGTAALLLALAAGCGDGGDGDGQDDGGTDDATDDATLGIVEITGNWDGGAPEGTGFRVSLFACPFTMPPDYFSEGTFDAGTGDVAATVPDVEPGEWCLMAYVDMDPDDGLAPVDGLDPVNATGDENANGALAIEVVAGQTTTVDLVFAI